MVDLIIKIFIVTPGIRIKYNYVYKWDKIFRIVFCQDYVYAFVCAQDFMILNTWYDKVVISYPS